jgi:LPS-assembly protein
MNRDGNYLAADQVDWNRKTGEVRRRGQCRRRHPEGDKLIGETSCSPTRCATARSTICWSCSKAAAGSPPPRTAHGELTTLDNAIYSPCPVTTRAAARKRPSWSITRAR